MCYSEGMGRVGARRLWGAVALECLVALVVACGGGDDEDDGGPPATLPATTSTAVLNEAAARALQTQAAITGSLAGVIEDPAGASSDRREWTACGQPIPVPDQRLLTARNVFRSPAGAPPAEFVEMVQTTTVHYSATAATASLAATFDLLDACSRSESDGQVTEGWAPAPVPAGVALDARAATLTLIVAAGGEVFPAAHGCVTAGPVVQCLTLWTRSAAETARWFDQALTVLSEHLARAMLD